MLQAIHMKNDDILGRRTVSPVDKFLEEERRRADLISRALGATSNLQKQFDALSRPLQQIASLQSSGAFGSIERLLESQRKQSKSLEQLMTPQWASAVQKSAIEMSRYNDVVNERLLSLGKSLDTGILNTAAILRTQDSALVAAMAATKWNEQFKTLAERLSPSLAVLASTIDSMAVLDAMVLRASADRQSDGIVHAAVQKTVEAQQIIEALAKVDNPEEGILLLSSFFDLVSSLFNRFGENTIEELRKLGLFGLLAIVAAILTIFPREPTLGMTAEQRQAFTDVREQLDALQDDLRSIDEAEIALSESFVAKLPRGEITKRSNIRVSPTKAAARILVAQEGMVVGVIRTHGRWRLIAFRDPLTDQLSQGWIYGNSVQTLGSE